MSDFICPEGAILIPLTGQRGVGKFAIVDADQTSLFERGWHLNSGYAAYSDVKQGKRVFMHHLVLPCTDGMEVDHINGSPLDNRRENLRLVTHAENMLNKKLYKNNKSGVVGVRIEKRSGRAPMYLAEVRRGEMRIRKRFPTLSQAIAFRRQLEDVIFGEFKRATP